MQSHYANNKIAYLILKNSVQIDIYGGYSKNRETISSKEPLNFVDWVTYVENNNLQLKMNDLRKMHNGDSIKIVASIIQSNGEAKWKFGDIVNPIDFFIDDIVTFTYPNILNGHEYTYEKSQFNPTYNPAEHDPIEPFYDDGNGNAVLGSGGDISILVSKLTNLPNIRIDN